ncbi:MAG: hypothetical protein K2R98_20345 [Gemmataceae bacterium]|nr:hypothetical protein [Gemmataceae bacterium]
MTVEAGWAGKSRGEAMSSIRVYLVLEQQTTAERLWSLSRLDHRYRL